MMQENEIKAFRLPGRPKNLFSARLASRHDIRMAIRSPSPVNSFHTRSALCTPRTGIRALDYPFLRQRHEEIAIEIQRKPAELSFEFEVFRESFKNIVNGTRHFL